MRLRKWSFDEKTHRAAARWGNKEESLPALAQEGA